MRFNGVEWNSTMALLRIGREKKARDQLTGVGPMHHNLATSSTLDNCTIGMCSSNHLCGAPSDESFPVIDVLVVLVVTQQFLFKRGARDVGVEG